MGAFHGPKIGPLVLSLEAHLIMADRAVSWLGLNLSLGVPIQSLDVHLSVEFIDLLVHLVHRVLHLQSTEHEIYSFKTCVWIRR